VGQPAQPATARRALRRRARHVVRKGARARPRGRRPAPRQLRGRLAHRRRAGRGGRRPQLQVVDDPERLGVPARQPRHAGLLPGRRRRGDRPRPARLRLLARLRALGRLQDRHQRRRRGRHRRGLPGPHRPGAARPRLRARARRQPAAAGVARARAHARGRAPPAGDRVRARERRQPRGGRPRRLARHRCRRQALPRPDARAAQPRPGPAPGHPRPQARDDLAARAVGGMRFRPGPRRGPRPGGEGPVPREPAQGAALRHGGRAAHRRQARRAGRAAAAGGARPGRRPGRPRGRRTAARPRHPVRLGRGAPAPARLDRRPRRRAADGAAVAVLLLGLPAQQLGQGARGHARRRRDRLPHDGAAQPRGQGRDHRHHADGRRGRAVDRPGAVHRRPPPGPEPRRRHVPPLRLLGDPGRGRRRCEHHLQAALQRPRRDDRGTGHRGPAAGAAADALAGARGRAADHRHRRGHEPLQGRRAGADRRAARPLPAAACAAGARRGRGRDRAHPRPGVRRRAAPRAQARQAGRAHRADLDQRARLRGLRGLRAQVELPVGAPGGDRVRAQDADPPGLLQQGLLVPRGGLPLFPHGRAGQARPARAASAVRDVAGTAPAGRRCRVRHAHDGHRRDRRRDGQPGGRHGGADRRPVRVGPRPDRALAEGRPGDLRPASLPPSAGRRLQGPGRLDRPLPRLRPAGRRQRQEPGHRGPRPNRRGGLHQRGADGPHGDRRQRALPRAGRPARPHRRGHS
jgi:hypothetical protein